MNVIDSNADVPFYVDKDGVEEATEYRPILREVNLGSFDIGQYIDGVRGGLNPKTMGWGMQFLHELIHTPAGPSGGLDDEEFGYESTVSTIDQMNGIRSELGPSYGQRRSYSGKDINDGRNTVIPFDSDTFKHFKINNSLPKAGF